jgi:signal transduction histidine kinase
VPNHLSAIIEIETLAVVLLSLVFAVAVWWSRERRLAAQRQAVRLLNRLAEDIIGAVSTQEIVEKLNQSLPGILRITSVRLHVKRPGTSSLSTVTIGEEAGGRRDVGFSGLADAAALCFKGRSLLNYSDTRRAPMFKSQREGMPRSLLFVPMLTRNEPLGVMELQHLHKPRNFNPDELGAAQHLGNQVATALRLLEQRDVREQLIRSEKLAAAGQLISGVADEISSPLAAISSASSRLMDRAIEPHAQRELAAIASEARRASEFVSRLVSFTRTDTSGPKPVDVNSLLSNLIRFREREWAARGITVSARLAADGPVVVGARSQLEQVFLNLLVHAEQSVANRIVKEIAIATSVLARRSIVTVSYSADALDKPDDCFVEGNSSSLGLSVCRGIVRSHGGDVRLLKQGHARAQFEVDLPVASNRVAEAAGFKRCTARQLTVAVVEPDPVSRRETVAVIGSLGHRAVPLTTGEEAAEIVDRLKFDLVVCSVHVTGPNWVELFERIRSKVACLVLMTEGYDSDLSKAFRESDARILSKPVDEKELAGILAAVEQGAEAAAKMEVKAG